MAAVIVHVFYGFVFALVGLAVWLLAGAASGLAFFTLAPFPPGSSQEIVSLAIAFGTKWGIAGLLVGFLAGVVYCQGLEKAKPGKNDDVFARALFWSCAFCLLAIAALLFPSPFTLADFSKFNGWNLYVVVGVNVFCPLLLNFFGFFLAEAAIERLSR